MGVKRGHSLSGYPISRIGRKGPTRRFKRDHYPSKGTSTPPGIGTFCEPRTGRESNGLSAEIGTGLNRSRFRVRRWPLLWPTTCGCSAVAVTGRLGSFMSSERTSRRLLMARPWTVEEDAVVLELFRRGKSPVTIAGKLRRTLSAVRSRRNKLLAAQGGDIGTGSRALR